VELAIVIYVDAGWLPATQELAPDLRHMGHPRPATGFRSVGQHELDLWMRPLDRAPVAAVPSRVPRAHEIEVGRRHRPRLADPGAWRPCQPWAGKRSWSNSSSADPALAARLRSLLRRVALRDTPTWMPRDKVDVARRANDAYNRRDVDGLFAELATPDFEYYPGIASALDGGTGYRGREGVDRFAADTSENWEELQTVADEFRDLGDRVLVLGRLKGRGKGSGVPVDQPFVNILDFRGDRIWRSRVYLDRAEGLRTAGLSE